MYIILFLQILFFILTIFFYILTIPSPRLYILFYSFPIFSISLYCLYILSIRSLHSPLPNQPSTSLLPPTPTIKSLTDNSKPSFQSPSTRSHPLFQNVVLGLARHVPHPLYKRRPPSSTAKLRPYPGDNARELADSLLTLSPYSFVDMLIQSSDAALRCENMLPRAQSSPEQTSRRVFIESGHARPITNNHSIVLKARNLQASSQKKVL